MPEPYNEYTKPIGGGQPIPPQHPGYPPQGYAPQGYPPQPYQQQPYQQPGAYQQTGGYQQPGMPPIVINNVASATAVAAAGYGYRGRLRKSQSFWVHFWLFCLTAGVGNVLYAWYVMDWNKKHGY